MCIIGHIHTYIHTSTYEYMHEWVCSLNLNVQIAFEKLWKKLQSAQQNKNYIFRIYILMAFSIFLEQSVKNKTIHTSIWSQKNLNRYMAIYE